MNYEMNNYTKSINTVSEAYVQDFMTKVFGYMSIGLLITAFFSFLTLSFQPLLKFALQARIFLIIADLAVVIYLAHTALKKTALSALCWFGLYAVLNGLTLAPIFLIYTHASVTKAFLITSGMFGAMAFWGYSTKKDLTSLGSFAFMGLIGIIIASVVNIFLKSSGMALIISYAGVGIFIALTAWDVQKLKMIATLNERKGSLVILGALTLYLDFINLFLHILYIIGGRRD